MIKTIKDLEKAYCDKPWCAALCEKAKKNVRRGFKEHEAIMYAMEDQIESMAETMKALGVESESEDEGPGKGMGMGEMED